MEMVLDAQQGRSVGSHIVLRGRVLGFDCILTTYEVERTIAFVGKFKLDWIFVKPPSLREPYAKDQPYRFAPHFGRTLKALNDSLKDRISDHAPLMVDLPLGEPPLRKGSEKRTIQTNN